MLIRVLAPVALLVHETATFAGVPRHRCRGAAQGEDVLGPVGDVLLMRARREAAGRQTPRSAAAELRPVLQGGPGSSYRGRSSRLTCSPATSRSSRRRPQARRELHRALAGAARSGALRPLLAADPAVVDLLARQIGSFGAGETVAARVLELRRAPPRTGVVAFTERERDVLALLSTPQSLTEIAAELGIAPSTVKTHTRAIYTKLASPPGGGGRCGSPPRLVLTVRRSSVMGNLVDRTP